MINPQLENKTVLISGANHGIGAATARAFAAQGAKVFITYYRDACRYLEEELEQAQEAGVGGVKLYQAMQQQPAEPLVDDIRSRGGIAVAHEADLSVTTNQYKSVKQTDDGTTFRTRMFFEDTATQS